MIVVKIQGGLGNQLFQFALAISLKTSNSSEKIAVDTTFFKTTNSTITNRQNFIHALNIANFPEATLKDFNSENLISKIKYYLFKKSNCEIINESSKEFIPSILDSKSNTYLNGYWHSYKYFEKATSEIKKQFSLKSPLSKYSQQQKEIILKAPASISIHIRRGDYITKYEKIYAHLNLDYYNSAAKLIKEKINKERVNIFVFSDDIGWCKQNFKSTEDVIFIENTTNKPDHEDLFLMSYCSHNIIANSSYSWWAAWLNANEQKIVIAPKNWYTEQSPEFNESIYPPTWTVL